MRKAGLISAAALLAASPALAEGIELSGVAKMGLASAPSETDPNSSRTRLLLDLEATVTVSRELDNGLTIGVEFDLPELDED